MFSKREHQQQSLRVKKEAFREFLKARCVKAKNDLETIQHYFFQRYVKFFDSMFRPTQSESELYAVTTKNAGCHFITALHLYTVRKSNQ